MVRLGEASRWFIGFNKKLRVVSKAVLNDYFECNLPLSADRREIYLSKQETL